MYYGLNAASPANIATPEPIYIDPGQAFNGDQGASTVLGKLYRAQWEDWKARFQGHINKLADQATNAGFITEQSDQAAAAVGSAYGNVRKGMAMQRQGMGLSLTEAQQQAEQRKLSLAQSADTNAAYNNARVSARDLQDKILAGGMGLDNIPNTNQQQR